MELTDLIGEHELTGVDFGIGMPAPSPGRYGNNTENTITFVLDGHVYHASEDPSDGYRSCLQDIVEVPGPVSNTFAPCRVLARMHENDDVLECLDVVTGKIVLEVGTGNSNDYYPYYVANFIPEHMACNQSPEAR